MTTWLLPGAKAKLSYCPEDEPCYFCARVSKTYGESLCEDEWCVFFEDQWLTHCLENPEMLKKKVEKYAEFCNSFVTTMDKIAPLEDPLETLKKLEEWGGIMRLCAEFKDIATDLRRADDSYLAANEEVDGWGSDSDASLGDYRDSKEDRREAFNDMTRLAKEAEVKGNEIHEAIAKKSGYLVEKNAKKRKRPSLASFLKSKPAYCGTVLRRCGIFSEKDVVDMPLEKWKERARWIAPFIYEELNKLYRD